MTRSPRLAASAMSRTLSPAASALARLEESGRSADDDVDSGVLEIERVGVALGAVTEDCDGLAVELAEVRVAVVEDVVGHLRAGL